MRFLVIACWLWVSGCTKDTLPPLTQTGANTFGCLINGKLFRARGSDGYSGLNMDFNFGYNSFFYNAHDYDNDLGGFFVFGADSAVIKQGTVVKLSDGLNGNGSARYCVTKILANNFYTSDNYYTSDSLHGEMTFIRLDEATRIASGTFWFDASNVAGEIIHVTEGSRQMFKAGFFTLSEAFSSRKSPISTFIPTFT
eukprot:gene55079-75473_t